MLIVGFHVSNRKSELLDIRLDQVDLKAKQLMLWTGTTKNKQGRTLPIYGPMTDCLSAQVSKLKSKFPECQFLFHNEGVPIQRFDKAWDSACVRAGVPELLFHDLRRSAVPNLTRAGVSRPVAMKITGHKTESVYVRYDIVDAADVADAGTKMEKYFEGGAA